MMRLIETTFLAASIALFGLGCEEPQAPPEGPAPNGGVPVTPDNNDAQPGQQPGMNELPPPQSGETAAPGGPTVPESN